MRDHEQLSWNRTQSTVHSYPDPVSGRGWRISLLGYGGDNQSYLLELWHGGVREEWIEVSKGELERLLGVLKIELEDGW